MNSTTRHGYYTFSIETVDVVLGISLNLILLFLIKKYSSAYLGTYKYLLAVFACYDVYLCMLHGLLNPVVIIVKNTFGANLYTPFQGKVGKVTIGNNTIAGNPHLLKLFSRPWFIILISVYPITLGIVWYIQGAIISTSSDDYTLNEVKVEFYKTRSQSVDYGWLVMDHWRYGQLNVRVMYVIVTCNIIIFGSLIMASTLATLTYREILKTTTLSRNHRTMQYALLVAVCAQTFVPLVCVYIPYFFIIMCPFLSISSGIFFFMANHYSFFVSVFPGWDALVIIILIRDYRLGFLKMFGLWHEKKILVRNTQFTTTNTVSAAHSHT